MACKTQGIYCVGLHRKCLLILALGRKLIFLLLLRYLSENIPLRFCWKALRMHRKCKEKAAKTWRTSQHELDKAKQVQVGHQLT